MKALSQVVRDWQIGAVLRYQSGALIGVPASHEPAYVRSWAGRTHWASRPVLVITTRIMTGQPLLNFNPELRMLQPADDPDTESGRLYRCPGRGVGHQRAVL